MAQHPPTGSGPSTSLIDTSSPKTAEQILLGSKQLAPVEPATLDTFDQSTAEEVHRRSEQTAPSRHLTEPPVVGASGHSVPEQVPAITDQAVVILTPPPAFHTSGQFAAKQNSAVFEHIARAEPTTSEISSRATTEPHLFSDVGSRTSEGGSSITADEFIDEGYAESNTTSYLSSIASNIRRGITENGRVYPNYGKNMYGMPMDEQELDRNDFQHHKWLLLLEGKLFLAPIPNSVQRILDLGTGTGIWAISMADRYPSALVTGVDIAPVQPNWAPPNCVFELDDVEDDWAFKRESFDFIYAREFIMAIRDWDRLIRQSYEHLKPGGWLELSASVPDIRTDDDSIPKDSAYPQARRILFEMATKMGTPLEAPRSWKDQVERIGFVEVKEVVYKLPMGPWPKDKRLKEIGAVERMMLLEGIEAYMLRGYTQVLGGDPKTLAIILAQAKRDLSDPKIHTYVFYHIVYGRKPGAGQP
jgi:SAM-dependent methyltransferase